MLDAVEKFRQVHVDALTITGTDVGLDLLRCSVGGAAWPKAETRFRESGIENRREDLQDGLLDQAIDHVGNSEISLTAIRFGNRLPPGRARLVLSDEWTAEIRRRSAEYDSGCAETVPWEQIKAEALRRAGLTVPEASY